MKKKRTGRELDWLIPCRKMLIYMKLLCVFLFGACLSLRAGVYAQDARVSLDLKEVSLDKVLHEISRQTQYDFLYPLDKIKQISVKDVKVENQVLQDFLNEFLPVYGLGYTFDQRVIVIRMQPDPQIKEYRIKGKVTDQKNNPLPGVTIMLQGAKLGTSTDANGEFTIDIVAGVDSLMVSFVGMKSRFVPLIQGKTDYLIRLEEDSQILEDIVVTGYGNVMKGNYTGATTTVKAADIMMDGVSSIDQMLQGIIPGMLVRNTTGQVGATSKIRVRGVSTLLGSQEPVWVVDGVIQRDPQPFNPEDNTKFSVDADDIKQLAGNAISWLNPNDIETITVLKDASATAIYGSKAANGVIVITTKKASEGKVAVNYNGSLSIGQRPHYGLYDRMNSAENMQFSKDIYDEKRKYATAILPLGYAGLIEKLTRKEITLKEMDRAYQEMARRNTDWFKLLFRNSLNHAHAVSISGGSEKLMNRTSLAYTEEHGEARGNEASSFTATSNTTLNLGGRLLVNFLLKGTVRNVKGFAYEVDPFRYAYHTTRVIPVYEEDGSLYEHGKFGTASYPIPNKTVYSYNILNELDNTGSRNTTRTWGTTVDLKWNIVNGLEYQGLVSYHSSSADSKKYAGERSFYITQTRGYEYGTIPANSAEQKASPLPFGGILETDLVNTTAITVRNSLVYDRMFKKLHRLTLQLGIETNAVKTKGEVTKRYGYLPDRGETFTRPPATFTHLGGRVQDNSDIAQGSAAVINRVENELSEYASVVYSYDHRYVVNLSARMDASNRFSQDKNKQFEPTWSAGLKWRLANERFAKEMWWLNNLDLYGSYGYQGNAVPSVSPYLIATDGGLNHWYQAYVLNVKSLPYADLGWEKTKNYNIGVDASLLKSRLNFTFNYFYKKSDVLASRNIPYENGMENGIVSGSVMKNYGYDLVIDVVPVRTKHFTWQISFNTAVTHNRVEKNNRVNVLEDYLQGSCIVAGRPYSTFYSYAFDGLDPQDGRPCFKNLDREKADSPLDFLVESGKFTPDFAGGVNTMLKYKNWSLYALFAVQWGGHGRLPELFPGASVYVNGLPKPEQNASRELLHRWKKQGDEAYTRIPSLPGTGNENIYLPALAPKYSQLRANLYQLYNLSDQRVANTDFIRCRSISLAYELKEEWLKPLFLRRMQVKASMTNPFMWVSDAKWKGLDPETGDWPARRVTSLSLQMVF